ncbi:MAG TPA: MFS transporter [Mogibacterium sp.]|nr:MFS transporter [Mogibacterium sp.]
MQNNNNEKLSLRTMIGYGVGTLGEGIGYNVFFSFFIFFLTTIAGIAPAVAGTVSTIAVLWDAVTDPMIGVWSDRTRNKNGRRRPFIRVGSLIFGFSIALLFINVNLPQNIKTIYYIFINLFYWIAMTSCVIPHTALGSELTSDFNERSKLRSVAVIFMNTGTLISTSLPLLIVAYVSKVTGSADKGWMATGIIYGCIVALVYNICYIATKGMEPRNPNLDDASGKTTKGWVGEFWRAAVAAFKNKDLARLVAVTFFFNIVVTLGSGIKVYFMTYVYGYNEAKASLLYLVSGIAVIIAVLPVGYLASKVGKKAVMVGGLLLWGSGFLIVGLLPQSDFLMFVVYPLAYFGNAAYWTMIYAMSYDTAIVEQLKTGERPDGLYTSLIGLFMKFGNALGTFVLGIGLQLVGFDASMAVQSASVLSGIRYLFAFGPVLALAIAVIPAVKYTMVQKKYELYSKAVENKEAGLPYDESLLEA